MVNLNNVNYSYDGDKPVLKGINLKIDKGQIVAFVGASGAGKSTLLHIISGYLEPDSGSAQILGNLISKPNKQCAVMFQDDNLFPWLTVQKNIELGLKITGEKDRKEDIDRLISTLGLSDLVNKKPNQLSGGQRQRVAFARSLATSPDLLALDEPFSALDPHTRLRLQRLVRTTIRNINKSLILVSHSIEEVIRMADIVFVLSAGRITDQIAIPLNESDRVDPTKTRLYAQHISKALVSEEK